jgi:hypothetical protein
MGRQSQWKYFRGVFARYQGPDREVKWKSGEFFCQYGLSPQARSSTTKSAPTQPGIFTREGKGGAKAPPFRCPGTTAPRW